MNYYLFIKGINLGRYIFTTLSFLAAGDRSSFEASSFCLSAYLLSTVIIIGPYCDDFVMEWCSFTEI